MKFFVPDESAEHAEDTYNDFRELHKAADRRIRSITFPGPKPGEEIQLLNPNLLATVTKQ